MNPVAELTSSMEPASLRQSDAVDESAPRPRRKQKSKASKGWNSMMKLFRRVHLYSGIFMFPWVLLYGVTGMFFNHPQAFTGGEVRSFSGAVAGGQLAALPTPQEMADELVAKLNTALPVGSEGASPRVRLSDSRAIEFNRELSYTVQADGVEHSVKLNPVTGSGEIRTRPSEAETAAVEEPANPLADVGRVEIENNAMKAAEAAIPGLLGELELPAGEISAGRRAPTLRFLAEIDGTPYVLNYNLGNGAITPVADEVRPEMDAKTFMQRLHLSRGYAPHWNVEWLWALIVDAMFLSMVFWGLSGLLMWWQIKRTRLLGSGFLVASLAVTVILVVGMHDSLTAGGSRGGHGGGGGGRGAGGAGAQGAAAEHGPGGHSHGAETGHQHGPGGQVGGNRGGGGRGGNRGGAAIETENSALEDGDEAAGEMRRGRGRGGRGGAGADIEGTGPRGGGRGRGGRGGMERPTDPPAEPETSAAETNATEDGPAGDE
ncbi:PepSY domain-containing protein [Rubinisphaera sp. JC750]|uniref:PepSY domain-containing protein n=1 Tax=Rubinisphaera sp. JC750 TaxID=2898658 RepID=UPI0028F3F3AB|nr:PepSY domain-containing protein [Rubinisphaera sp. JC750]